jgi:pSer/pThr/pTyr-binding forkhead associated (FHA) protein
VLGRDLDLHVCLEFPTVSRRHASIRIGPDRALLHDLGSKNGTWLNGRRVAAAAELSDGDEIRLGSLRLRLRRGPSARSTETASPER